jgi:hypothetical protein
VRVGLGPALRTCGAILKHRGNAFRRLRRGFVLPDPYHCPTGFAEARIRVAVAGYIRFDLVLPKVRVTSRPRHMVRTAVPKTSVDEDRHAMPAEDNVNFTTGARNNPLVHPESQATSV